MAVGRGVPCGGGPLQRGTAVVGCTLPRGRGCHVVMGPRSWDRIRDPEARVGPTVRAWACFVTMT